MAKFSTTTTDTANSPDQLFSDLKRHYDWASRDTDRRRTGRGRIGSISFDEADELFRSWIDETKWPYDALLFDPRVFTFIFEKTSRLLSSKLKGRLIPREGSDVLAAHINNELLDFQWDQANHGGTMLSKWALMDLNTRKYGASFAVCKWRYEKDKKGRVLFDGPEMRVLNNRDCLPDPTATSIENANWFQVREYITIQELQSVNDAAGTAPIYKNLSELKDKMEQGGVAGGDSRDTNWISRNRTISGLSSDPVGQDQVFRNIEIVTEYRRDRWITFSPKHGVILRDIPNPYDNNELPIVMLRYYQIDDDIYGMSEIEPVKGLQKAINALLSQYVDEINQKLYSPIAIGPGVREHTLHWGKGARWRMSNPMTDFRLVESRSNAAQFFNSTYSALVAALMNAVGSQSIGVSNINRYNPEKTAQEVKAMSQQQNARDNFNQNFLAEALERQMSLWYSMNQKMLFSDPKKIYKIIRIVGRDAIAYFQERGLDQMTMDPEAAMNAVTDPTIPRGEPYPAVGVMVPKNPVNVGSADKPSYMPKLHMESNGQSGFLYLEPSDLMGTFDFIADVQSMSLGSEDEGAQGRKVAVQTMLASPVAVQLLAQEGVKPKFKDLFVAWLEDSGFKNADKFFETSQAPAAPGQGGVQTGPGQEQKLSQPEATAIDQGGNPLEALMQKMQGAQGGGMATPPPQMPNMGGQPPMPGMMG